MHNFAQEGLLVISKQLTVLEDFDMHLHTKGQEISVFHYSEFETSRAHKDCLTGTNLGIPAWNHSASSSEMLSMSGRPLPLCLLLASVLPPSAMWEVTGEGVCV